MTDLSKQRVVDPVLTALAQGYYNGNMISEVLFPIAETQKEGGKIPTFGRLAFRLQTTKRELRAASNRLTPEDIGSLTVVLEENDILWLDLTIEDLKAKTEILGVKILSFDHDDLNDRQS